MGGKAVRDSDCSCLHRLIGSTLLLNMSKALVRASQRHFRPRWEALWQGGRQASSGREITSAMATSTRSADRFPKTSRPQRRRREASSASCAASAWALPVQSDVGGPPRQRRRLVRPPLLQRRAPVWRGPRCDLPNFDPMRYLQLRHGDFPS